MYKIEKNLGIYQEKSQDRLQTVTKQSNYVINV